MGARAEGKASGSDVVGKWEQENGVKTQTIVARWWERSWKRIEGFDDEEDNGWGCDQGPNECRRDIGKQDIGFGNGLNGGKSGMLDDSVGEWMGEGLGSYPRSTKTLLVEERVLRQTQGGKRRQRCWRTRWCGWIGR